jgi:hypothetical protein
MDHDGYATKVAMKEFIDCVNATLLPDQPARFQLPSP